MKFYAIAVGFNKETKEPVYNTISTDWDETRSLVQGVSKKKDNIQTYYKSCGSLKEADEYLDGILAESLEVQAFEIPNVEEIMNNRKYPENMEDKDKVKEQKKETIKNVKNKIENKEKDIVLSVEDVNVLIEESPELIEKVVKEKSSDSEDIDINEDETEIIKVPEIPLDENEEIIEETVVVKIDREIPVYKEDIIEPKKQKDSIDLYMINTYRSYDEKTNYIAYGYTITKNGVTLKSNSYIEKSKEPTVDGANLLGSMYAVEQGAEELKRLIPENENLIVMVGHLEKHLEPSILEEIQPDNGEYFFDWLKLYYSQNEHIQLMFDTIIVKYPEKNYIKLQVDVKKLLKSKSK